MRRLRAATIAALLLVLTSASAHAYPDRPIRLLVGFGAGGTSDIIARLFAQEMSEILGQPMPVENRTGAGGNVAFEAAARAEPDGHTIVLTAPGFATNHALYRGLRWRQEDLTPVILIGYTPVAILVRPDLPVRTLRELIEHGRARGTPLLAGIAGSGTSSHLANILFRSASRLALENVAYTGGATPFLDLIAGRLDLMTFPAPEVVSYMQAGQVRVLAITERTAAPAYRDTSTVAQAGLPEAAMTTWYGILAPSRTPPAAIAALNRAAAEALAKPAVRSRLAELSVDPAGGSPGEFGAFIARATKRWTRVIAETGARID